MLLTKYIEKGNGHVTQLMNIIPKKIFKRSLQAQKESWQQKRKRALRFASCTGSVTVETVLVLPVFLCVLCGLMLLGSLLLTEARIQYALARTADVYAAQYAVEGLADNQGSSGAGGGSGSPSAGQAGSSDAGDGTGSLSARQAGSSGSGDGTGSLSTRQAGGSSTGSGSLSASQTGSASLSERVRGLADGLLQKAGLQAVFHSVYEETSMDEICIRGGRAGIRLSVSSQGEEDATLKVSASYRLKIGIPFVGEYSFARQAQSMQRVFCGYVEHGDGKTGADSQGVVYVAEHGSVYHTSLSCTHICRRISDSSVDRILSGKKYQACDKCIHEGERPSVLYVTPYGEKYHSSLSCSGLKRTVKAIPKEEAEGMRMCSRCAAKQGKS